MLVYVYGCGRVGNKFVGLLWNCIYLYFLGFGFFKFVAKYKDFNTNIIILFIDKYCYSLNLV